MDGGGLVVAMEGETTCWSHEAWSCGRWNVNALVHGEELLVESMVLWLVLGSESEGGWKLEEDLVAECSDEHILWQTLAEA